jgi:FtsZ-binding cell division protein ZapB
MSEAGERLQLLERHVQRAIELIESLRAENDRLVRECARLSAEVETLTKEVAAARQREQALVKIETEHRRLVEERMMLLGQVEGMLKELARIEVG